MTYKQQLTEELCTVPEIEKQIKELKFGCKLKINKYNLIYDCIDTYDIVVCDIVFDGEKVFSINWNILSEQVEKKFQWKKSIKEIIWNPIEYHHLMMYCESKNISMRIESLWIIYINANRKICDFDNTKPLSEQSEEVYEQILIALKELNL